MAEGLQPGEEQQRNWSELEVLILHKIYAFLRRTDRANVALVCEQWSKELDGPEIWKSFHFDFTCEQLDKNADAIMEFVKNRCNVFKRVQITWNIGTEKEKILKWLKYFKDFDQLLSSAERLDSVKFDFERYNIVYIRDSIHKSVCKEIADFMKSKRNLKRLEIYNCSFFYKESIDLLKKIIENNRGSLKHLVLRGFVTAVSPGNVDDSTNQFHLPSLETLKIDYLVLFGIGSSDLDDFNEKLRYCRKELNLKFFILLENPEGASNFKNLFSKDWKNVKRKYPNLEIELKLSFRTEVSRVFPIIFVKKSMPITHLSYLFNYPRPRYISDLSEIYSLDHYVQHWNNEHLVDLSLKWEHPIDDLLDLFSFVSRCRKLKLLKVTKVHPVTRLRDFLESLRNNRPESLEKFILIIAGTGNENDKVVLRNLADEFEPRLKLINLTFDLQFIELPCRISSVF